MKKLYFASDYQEGAHPSILKRLSEINCEKYTGYGSDTICASAKEKIRAACKSPDAEIYFLVGGTQTNTVIISSLLHPWQGVIAPETGHIALHEAGSIEACGHKVLPVPAKDGKITASDIQCLLETWHGDANREHMVMPGMVYLSQPTESGTLYSRSELTAISNLCRAWQIPLYIDGARLAYALACPENDVTLADLASLTDVFYIGGTKCGALLGEAVVIPSPGLIPHLFTLIKQHGALLAKGWIAGVQFDELFTDGLYEKIGDPAIEAADRIRAVLTQKGIPLCFGSPTNQVFCCMPDPVLRMLDDKVEYSFWETYDADHTIIRFAASWAATKEDTDQLINLLNDLL